MTGSLTEKNNLLIIFARKPTIGEGKRRLALSIGDENACRFYESFLEDVLANARGLSFCQKAIFFTPEEGRDYFESFANDFLVVPQARGDLGQKMSAALGWAQERGYAKTVIIGTDAPDLPNHLIEEAFLALDGHDCVLGPSHDGGYYLIGAGRPLEIFDGIVYSRPDVLSETLKKTQKFDLAVHLLAPWSDVDDVSGLNALMNRAFDDGGGKTGARIPSTRAMLKEWQKS